MRLRKPSLVSQLIPTITTHPFTSSPLIRLADASIVDPSVEGIGLTGLAALPNGFGSMFVGTNFLAYVCLNNESDVEVTQVEIAAELRSAVSKTVLSPSMTRLGANDLTNETSFTLQPGEALHIILDHSTPTF